MSYKINNTEKLLCLGINPYSSKKEIEELLEIRIDWKYFTHLAKHHRIAPLIYFRLKQMDLLKDLPINITDQLKKSYLGTLSVNMLLGEALEEILINLDQHRIDCVVLKGNAFIGTIYGGNPGVRPQRDIDLLIRKRDLIRSVSILKEMGYQFYGSYQNEETYLKHHFHLPFTKRIKGFNIFLEIHWHIIAPHLPVRLNIDDFWKHAIEFETLDMKIKSLSFNDAFIYLVWHSAYNGFEELLTIADVLYLLKHHGPAGDDLARRIKEANLVIPLFWVSHILRNLYQTNLLPSPQIDLSGRIFVHIYFTEKNILEQFVKDDWTVIKILHIFLYRKKLFHVKKILLELPPLPRSLKVIVHYVYMFLRILLRFFQTRA